MPFTYRTEVKGVPNLLVAPRSPRVVATDQQSNYEHGYYADGAYTAVPDATIRLSNEEDDDDPQEKYYTSLCSRFSTLSATLQYPPPISATPAAPATEQACSFHPSSSAQWRRCIFNTQPRMLLLSQVGQADVVSGLAVLETLLTFANLQKRKNIGAWAWGLLARCREVGQMGSEEVGVLRDLGKKARGIIRGIMAGIEEEEELEEEEDEVNVEDGQEGEEDGQEGEENGMVEYGDSESNEVVRSKVEGSPREESLRCFEGTQLADHNANTSTESMELSTLSSKPSDPLAAARQRLLDSLKPSSHNASECETSADPGESRHGLGQQKHPHEADETEDEVDQQNIGGDDEIRLRIRATLDMIVTIVGEFYGQRDLLDGRLLWGELQQDEPGSRNGM